MSREQIGPYRLLEVIGTGGMGTVHRAEQRTGIRREVALKVVKLGMDSEAVVRRFEQERQALAMMDHKNIARVFDCGTSERGQPFFAMELVKGIPIDAFCEKHRLALQDRIRLMQEVCAAVQHAHQKGVVHRDLKPGNILVSGDPGAPQVKVIDFGLAKALGQKLVDVTLFTEAGQIVGTPEYMAPEQADPGNQDIDTRADIYSLGVILYQLLVGELPFPTETLRRAGMLGIQRILQEEEPVRPSSKLRSRGAATTIVARTRRVSLPYLRSALRTDLDWVVLKALEKDRARRYQTAKDLADDLARFLDHEPLEAGPPSASYRIRKLLRRYRGRCVAAGVILLVLIAGALGTWLQYQRAEAKVAEFDLLAGVLRYDQAEADAELLGPAWPERIPALVAWLDGQCRPLLAVAPSVSAARARLAQTNDRTSDAERFLGRELARLEGDLAALDSWTRPRIEARLRWAREIAALTREHPNAQSSWDAVREHLARHPAYRDTGITLEPEAIHGLVPMGANPATGLLEFYHLRSAWDGAGDPARLPIPSHGPDGAIAMDGTMGMVFVLLPGGPFLMGAQASDQAAPRYDPQARPEEGPPRTLALGPFLISRFEITQGQWLRLAATLPGPLGRDPEPSWFRRGNPVFGASSPSTVAHPVENLSWSQCAAMCHAHGLRLPHEGEWEYACRGVTDTVWSTGDDRLSLAGHANLLDLASFREKPSWGVAVREIDDGWVHTAPVGRYLPNRFGLHDMHGNVWEWCSNPHDPGGFDAALASAHVDPAVVPARVIRTSAGVLHRAFRGGCFYDPPENLRAARRAHEAPERQSWNIGMRPARDLDPGWRPDSR